MYLPLLLFFVSWKRNNLYNEKNIILIKNVMIFSSGNVHFVGVMCNGKKNLFLTWTMKTTHVVYAKTLSSVCLAIFHVEFRKFVSLHFWIIELKLSQSWYSDTFLQEYVFIMIIWFSKRRYYFSSRHSRHKLSFFFCHLVYVLVYSTALLVNLRSFCGLMGPRVFSVNFSNVVK